MVRRSEQVFLGVAAALALATALRMPAAWESGNALNHVSGAWMTLADDLARGTFYRPLVDGDGYGGTRFFPLAFGAHAALIRAGADLLPGGYAVAALAGLLLVLGAYLLLRRLGVSRPLALGFTALALAGFGVQYGLSSVRGDVLPVALSALALSALAPGPNPRRLAVAAVLLALAFSAKPTALTAAAAAVAWLLLRREPRAAGALAAGVAVLAAGVVLVTDALSEGRFLALLRACATGGADLEHALRAPVRLASYLAIGDASGLVLLLAAAASLALALPALARALRAGDATSPLLLPALWLAAGVAGVVTVFASPGTGTNHLVEVEVAAAVALGAAVGARGRAAELARISAPAAAVAGIVLVLSTWNADGHGSRLGEVRAVVRALPPGDVLSEDPLVPLVAGERPVLLDAWMLRLAAARAPDLAEALGAKVARGHYAAVVLFQNLDAPGADAWYADRNLGLALVEQVRRGYRRAGAIGRYHLYVPRAPSDAIDPSRVSALGGSASVVPGSLAR
jgi:hypothetical protein